MSCRSINWFRRSEGRPDVDLKFAHHQGVVQNIRAIGCCRICQTGSHIINSKTENYAQTCIQNIVFSFGTPKIRAGTFSISTHKILSLITMRLFRRKNKNKKQFQRQVEDLQGEVKFLQKRLLSMHVKYNDAKYEQQQDQEQMSRFESPQLRESHLPDPLQQGSSKSTKDSVTRKIAPETALPSSTSKSLLGKEMTRNTLLHNESRILEREVVNEECRQDHSLVQRGLQSREESFSQNSMNRKIPSLLSKDIVVHVTEEEPEDCSDAGSLQESETSDCWFMEEPRVPIKVLLRPKSIVYKWNRYADMEENGIEVAPRHRTKLAKIIEAQKQRKHEEALQHSQKDANFKGSSCCKETFGEKKAHNSVPTMNDFLTELRAKQQDRILRLQSS